MYKTEQNDCNNESNLQEHNKYIKGDVLFEFSIVGVKIIIESFDSSKDNLLFETNDTTDKITDEDNSKSDKQKRNTEKIIQKIKEKQMWTEKIICGGRICK